jgi:hypothetical protein
MAPILAAWSTLASAGHEVYASPDDTLSAADVAAYEAATNGGRLPIEIRTLYEVSRGGLELPTLGVGINPWPPQTATGYGVERREGHPLPDQLHVFGGNLGDDVWTFWLRRGEIADETTVLVIGDHDAASIRSAGDPVRFLALETAVALVMAERDTAVELALDALGVPDELRDASRPESEIVGDLAGWADPIQREHGYYGTWEPLTQDRLEGLARDLP